MAPKIDMLGGVNMAQELKRSIASHRREMLEFAHELIAIPTEYPPGSAAKECARIPRDRLRCMCFRPLPGGSVRSFYGRSSSDMKGGRAAMIYAVRAIQTRFYNRIGMPALAYGPGLLSVSHGPSAFVPVRNIFDCALIYALTAIKVLNAHSGTTRNA
jgi:hypothetical protein